jgi:hypothetical protein
MTLSTRVSFFFLLFEVKIRIFQTIVLFSSCSSAHEVMRLEEVRMTRTGFEHDRQWMVVSADTNNFLSQRYIF